MERNKRVDWVDAAKGTGILLIIGAHSIRPDMREAQMVCKFIYDLIDSVAIGMFIVLAGVTYRMSGSWSTAFKCQHIPLHKNLSQIVPRNRGIY